MSDTKKCKHCKSYIDKKAKICPVCKKKQGSVLKFIIIGLAIIIIIGALASQEDDSNNPNSNTAIPTSPANNVTATPAAQSEPTVTPQPTTAPEPTATPEPQTTSFKAGTYKVGSDIPAGEYVVFNDGLLIGYYEVTSDSSGSLDSIISNDNFEYNTIITLNDGEYLKMQGSHAIPIEEANELDTSGAGMFKIGLHLPAGEYKLECTDTTTGLGYYEVTSDSLHDLDSIAANDNFEGNTYVTVKNGQYLKISSAKIVK